jgi:predicted aldo/keto reductase-like oxidoreductase
MTGFNFYDRFNFPQTEETLIPLAKERGTGIVGMKALGDGLLWEYPEEALRYVLSLPIDVLPLGFNAMEMLRTDLRIARDFTPLSEDERDSLFRNNPLLGNYVCRQCGDCLPCPEGIDMPKIFLCEGWYDRQLRDRVIRSTADFALRDRVRFWFENMEEARGAYGELDAQADRCTNCGECNPRCPYGIDIPAKLDYAHFKLTTENVVSIPLSG